MIVKYNENLSKYTHIKIGGIAKKFYIPETTEEILNLIKNIKGKYNLLAGGSNILINDKKYFDNVILLTKFSHACRKIDNEMFYFGSSVRNTTMINFLNKNGYGGLEFMISVPGTVGGAIVMNAGLGRNKNLSISDYIFKVEIIKDGKIEILNKEECNFSYRKSRFQDEESIIVLGCYITPVKQTLELSKKKIKERLEYCKKIQDLRYPNLGTVFCKADPKIMNFLRIFNFKKNGVIFSKKKNNWLINKGNGTFLQAISNVKLCVKLHKLFSKDIEVEIKIWE